VHGSTRWAQFRAGSVTKRSPQWAVLCVSIGHAENMSGGRCPDRAGLPHVSVQAGARTGPDCRTSQVCATGRGPRKLGRAADRVGPSQQGPACPQARATGRVSQAAGGVLTGPWPSPAAVPGAAWAGAGRLGPRLRRGRGPGATDGRDRTAPGHAKCKGPTQSELCLGDNRTSTGHVVARDPIRAPRCKASSNVFHRC
jgi:hypothetical protein